VVALDATTGDVLAWVGGRDFLHSRFDRVKSARARRAAHSSRSCTPPPWPPAAC
jgi:membrane carboxypeptidase/penicillin-binding protein